MKNYFNYQNLYDQLNHLNGMLNQNQPIQNQVDSSSNLYLPLEGFLRGNMFKKSYDPYKNSEPYRIKPANEQAELLTQIDSLCFACIDLNLYLDIFPDDREVLDLFNRYRKEKIELTRQYEMKFGPLTTDSEALQTFPWDWIGQPWPWENR